MDKRANMLRVIASKDIQAGEQLSISYSGDCEAMSWRAREKYLEHWMPLGCECERCSEEKIAEEE